MNVLPAKITQIQTDGSLSLVTLTVGSLAFSTIVVDTPETASYLQIGNKVKAVFKETEVVIGRGDTSQISLRNQVKGIVSEVQVGKLLARVAIETSIGPIISIITTKSCTSLGILKDEQVTAMIKTNEIMLSQDV